MQVPANMQVIQTSSVCWDPSGARQGNRANATDDPPSGKTRKEKGRGKPQGKANPNPTKSVGKDKKQLAKEWLHGVQWFTWPSETWHESICILWWFQQNVLEGFEPIPVYHNVWRKYLLSSSACRSLPQWANDSGSGTKRDAALVHSALVVSETQTIVDSAESKANLVWAQNRNLCKSLLHFELFILRIASCWIVPAITLLRCYSNCLICTPICSKLTSTACATQEQSDAQNCSMANEAKKWSFA